LWCFFYVFNVFLLLFERFFYIYDIFYDWSWEALFVTHECHPVSWSSHTLDTRIMCICWNHSVVKRFSCLQFLGEPLQVTVRPMLRDICLSVCKLAYCGQSVGWIKIALGTEVRLGPGDIVLDRDPAAPPRNGAQQPPPTFGSCLLWPDGRSSQLLLSCCCCCLPGVPVWNACIVSWRSLCDAEGQSDAGKISLFPGCFMRKTTWGFQEHSQSVPSMLYFISIFFALLLLYCLFIFCIICDTHA